MVPCYYPILLFFFVILLVDLIAAQKNRTIDDTLGDRVTGAQVVYLPTSFNGSSVWNSSSSCANCNTIIPDSTRAYDNTWTIATYFSDITKIMTKFNFTGTAVYIYIIQSNNPTTANVNSSTILRFNLDGHVVGNYAHTSDQSSNFEYNVLAYSSTSLVDANHTFIFETTGPDPSTVIFDYAIYTFNDQATSSTVTSSASTSTSSSASNDAVKLKEKKAPIGAIVGGVIGGIAVFALLALVLYHRRIRPQHMAGGGTGIVDLDEATREPPIMDLQQQITERRHKMSQLEQNSQLLSRTEVGSDMRQQMEEMRSQIQRLEAQQRSRSNRSSDLPTGSSLDSRSAASTDNSQNRSRRARKREQPPRQNRPPEPEVLVHSDSGLRTNSDTGLLELPPAYVAE